jgi:nicotinate-nucleotide--dimethylbenzimidazole phosphoribosyltransferase
MSALHATIASISPADEAARAATARALDAKAKPRGSLGAIEELASRIAAIRGMEPPSPPMPAIVVVAADHGVAAENVSAYPGEVTAQMLRTFASGGAAVCVLSRLSGSRLVVVDAGVVGAGSIPGVRRLGFGPGTANFTRGPAMSHADAISAAEAGIALADELIGDGIDVAAVGDMGIANTTSAAAVCAALLRVQPESVCGRGTGVDDAGMSRKIAAVRRGLSVNRVDASDPIGVLAGVGGFEIAVLSGLVLGCAAGRIPVVLDGVVVAAAALVAARLAPACVDAMIAATRSPEPAHTLVLLELGLSPLLDLGLRLGEASGAALALPLVRAALALLDEMATFATAGVTNARV